MSVADALVWGLEAIALVIGDYAQLLQSLVAFLSIGELLDWTTEDPIRAMLIDLNWCIHRLLRDVCQGQMAFDNATLLFAYSHAATVAIVNLPANLIMNFP